MSSDIVRNECKMDSESQSFFLGLIWEYLLLTLNSLYLYLPMFTRICLHESNTLTDGLYVLSSFVDGR